MTKVKLRKKDRTFGNVYDVMSKGKEFTINAYPRRDRSVGSAKYAVHERYGEFLGKTRTLKGARKLIEER